MKRSPELRDLSEQHHYGLVAARTLRLAASEDGDLSAAVASFLHTWHTEIRPHFEAEESVLLPEFARIVGEADPLITQTLREHAALRRLIGVLAESPGDQSQTAAQVARDLHDHIRFEERVLFPAIEAACAGAPLVEIGRNLHSPLGRHCSRPS